MVPMHHKWKKRYFVLSSGQLPGQCRLLYYMDNAKTHLRGSINLDQCEQLFEVDAYLTFESKNQRVRYEWIFDIRVPKRVYYLVAINESEMNSWVNDLCCVCNLQKEDEPQSGTERSSLITHTANVDQCAENNSLAAATKYSNGFPNRVPLGNSTMVQPADRSTVSVANGAINRTSAQGYIPLTDCISGPPRPVRDLRDRFQMNHKPAATVVPVTDRPPTMASSPSSKATVDSSAAMDVNDGQCFGKGSERVPFVEHVTLKPESIPVPPPPRSPARTIPHDMCAISRCSPPPRPPKRGEFTATDRKDIGCFLPPVIDSSVSEDEFHSLPRNQKRKISSAAQCSLSSSFFESNTLPLPVRNNDLEMRSDEESKISGSLQISDSASTISNSVSSENVPMDDYQNMTLPPKSAGLRLPPTAEPPEVHRELKPQRYKTSFGSNALHIPSSKETQPHLPYRIDREQKPGVSGIGRRNVNVSSIDLSRRISFSKRRDANGAESSSRVGMVSPRRRRRATSTSASLTESDEEEASSDAAPQMEYVELKEEEATSALRLPLSTTTGSSVVEQTTGKPLMKTSYVIISQEKTQALIKTKSEQDTMYRIGTLERSPKCPQKRM
ncbi:unnamed protein product [Soboliphyme baturini]|uniref:PH domain-containing protein n=1 Tax=Soboliphyme baturini TaxID=241478 RepID=A0A183IGN3_9BILA|nr:unnamed protein product [Soboliphyme baturini]